MPPLERTLEPEWLDELPGDDPRAVRSRRDLRLMNRIMGHAGAIVHVLRGRTGAAPRVVELGAGDGTLGLRIARRCGWTRAEVVLVDRAPVVDAQTVRGYRELGCRVHVERADVFEWLAREEAACDIVFANLFLHHFDDARLAALLALAARCSRVFVGCEPLRARLPLVGSRFLGLIGCNDVTRHDARLSVRAGFSGDELSALWPAESGWRLEERRAGAFSHLFVARRVADSDPQAA